MMNFFCTQKGIDQRSLNRGNFLFFFAFHFYLTWVAENEKLDLNWPDYICSHRYVMQNDLCGWDCYICSALFTWKIEDIPRSTWNLSICLLTLLNITMVKVYSGTIDGRSSRWDSSRWDSYSWWFRIKSIFLSGPFRIRDYFPDYNQKFSQELPPFFLPQIFPHVYF